MAGVIAKSSNIGTVLARRRVHAAAAAPLPGRVRARQRTDVGMRGETARHPAAPARVDTARPGPDRLRPGRVGQRRADGGGRQHDRQRRGAHRSAELIKGTRRPTTASSVGTDARRPPPGDQPGGRPPGRADDGAGRRPRGRHRARRGSRRATGWPERPAPRSGSGDECGCYDGTFTVSFAGFAPADDPRFTIYVVVQNPRNGGGGARSAARRSPRS